MGTYYGYQKVFPAELNITVAATPVDVTFAQRADLVVVYSPIALWVHHSDVATPGDGTIDGARIFIPAAVYRVLPWRWDTFKCVNAELGQTGAVYVEGWVE